MRAFGFLDGRFFAFDDGAGRRWVRGRSRPFRDDDAELRQRQRFPSRVVGHDVGWVVMAVMMVVMMVVMMEVVVVEEWL